MKYFINSKIRFCLFFLTFFFISNIYSQTIRYVKPISSGTGAGDSWANASADIQAMINLSNAGDQIWVAAGTYKPNRRADDLNILTPNDSFNSFVLKEGVKLYGSFAGTETSLNERILPIFNETAIYSSILSGDFAGDDVVTGSGVTFQISNNEENANHVVVSVGTTENPISANTLIDGFKITGANAKPDMGLLIINQQEVFNKDGGGIVNFNADITITNVAICNNYAHGTGGGMYNINSSPQISNLVINFNQANDGGGGIANIDSSPTIVYSFINNNRGNGYYSNFLGGGGMYNSNSATIIENTTINGNVANYGGGVYNYNSDAVFTNVTINGNNASYGTSGGDGGGGMANYLGEIILNNVTIANNIADGYGGGIQNHTSSPIMNNVTITGNICTDGGGGIFNYTASPTLNNVIVNNNSVSYGEGGGILNRQMSAPVLTNVTINDNTGSGISIIENSVVIFTDGIINGNSGDGIYIWSSEDSIFENIIINNNYKGIFNFSDSSFFNIEVTNNTNRGIFNSNSASIYSNCTISGNTGSDGAGIYNSSSTSLFINTDIFDNVSTGEGGGIKNFNSSTAFDNCRVYQNNALEGGGMFNFNSDAVIRNTSFSGNIAFNGGGIFNEDSSSVFTNVVVTGNNANGSGGGVCNKSSSPIFTNVTISGNKSTSTTTGAVSNANSSYPVFRNSIIWGNSSGVNSSTYNMPTFYHSLVQGQTDVNNGNINGNINPLFTDAPSFTIAPFIIGDYTLQAASPAIGAGNNIYFNTGQVPDLSSITTDRAGNERIQMDIIDIGAYEYTEPCVTPAPEIESQALCAGATVADLPSLSFGLQWYDSETGEVSLTEDTIITPGIYFVSQTIDNCESPRAPVEVFVTIVPAPTGLQTQVLGIDLPLNATIQDLIAEGENIQWYESEAAIQSGIYLEAETMLISGQDYYATQTIDGCESLPLLVTVTSSMGTVNFDNSNLKYYPNPVTTDISIQYTSVIDLVTVYTLQGQKVIDEKWNNSEGMLNLTKLSEGSYIIKIISGDTSKSFLIIKQ